MSDEPEIQGIPNHPFPLKRIVIGLLAVAGVFIVAALTLPKSAQAKGVGDLSSQQTQQLKSIQTYLNAISTMRARFLQITSQGNFAQGQFSMQRPGLMRIEYDPPSPVLLVSDGFWMMYKDKELDQRSYTLLSTVPASMFIGEKVDFFGDEILVANYVNEAGVIRLSLQRSSDPAEGALTLVFAAKPLALKQWSVLDAQGITTTVSLLGPEFGVTFQADNFKIENKPRNKPN